MRWNQIRNDGKMLFKIFGLKTIKYRKLYVLLAKSICTEYLGKSLYRVKDELKPMRHDEMDILPLTG